MHELAVASDLLDLLLRVAAENGASSVTSVRLRLGVASCLEPEALCFGFEALADGTAAAKCALEITRVAAPSACSLCGWEGEVATLERLECPGCGGFPVTLRGGRELTVETVTVD